MAWHFFFQHPVLSIDVTPNNILLAGLATGDIAVVNMADNAIARLGGHEAPICGIFFVKQKNIVISLGYDNLILFWSLEESNSKPIFEVKLGLKTHTCSFDYPYLLIGSS